MTTFDHFRPPQDGGRLTNVSHGNHLGRYGIVVDYHMEGPHAKRWRVSVLGNGNLLLYGIWLHVA